MLGVLNSFKFNFQQQNPCPCRCFNLTLFIINCTGFYKIDKNKYFVTKFASFTFLAVSFSKGSAFFV